MLGEAAARVSTETRAAHPELPWRQMVGMRNRMVHEYFQVDVDVLWDVVRYDLPHLITRLTAIVPVPEEIAGAGDASTG